MSFPFASYYNPGAKVGYIMKRAMQRSGRLLINRNINNYLSISVAVLC